MDVLFASAGSMRPLYETVDWAATDIGHPTTWSPTLRSAVDLMLHTRFPLTLMWGRHFAMLYNEAYVRLIVDKHPAALGARASTVFPEIWEFIGPMLDDVYRGGPATFQEDNGMLLNRRGFLEECYFTFSFSPTRGSDDAVEGVFAIAAETTRTTIDRRRLALLANLNAGLADLLGADEVRARALPLLRAATQDLPAVDIVQVGRADTEPVEDVAIAPRLPVRGVPVVQSTATATVASFRLDDPSNGDTTDNGVLRVQLSHHLPMDEPYLAFLGLLASTIGQAVSRARGRESERRVAELERAMSETLQRSLLTAPAQADQLQVAVRYQPAVEQAQVGGDWYDSFLHPGGALTVVVGDVSGHDEHAAAAMAQVRNLLRGVAYTLFETPSRLLTRLDAAMEGLAVGAGATAVLAQVELEEVDAMVAQRTLRWSNAGHPPPILITPGGAARLLETPPEVMLGVSPQAARADHTLILEPGATVVFYTDGLVERRHASIEDGFDYLRGFLDGRAAVDAEDLCDQLLAEFGPAADDDIVLLVLRAHPRHPAPRRADR